MRGKTGDMNILPTPHGPRRRLAGWPRCLTAFGVALLAACGSGTTMPAQTPDDLRERYPEIPTAAVDVQAQPLAVVTTPLSQIPDARRTVLTSESQWRQYWALFYGNISPTPEPVPIDFGSDMVVVATSGTRPSGGYTIQIEGVFETNGELLVAVLETAPGAGCMTTQSLSAPATAVRVAASSAAVRFLERSETSPCS